MNKSLYNKIITSVSKVIKKSINEAYDTSIYDNWYESFDELSILNSAGKIGDILQINQYGDEYRVKSANSDINESMFDDIDFEDDDYSVSISDKLIKWKDLAMCFGEGLWIYLDWIGLNKELLWAQAQGITRLYENEIPDTNGYENTQYILNNYKNCIQDTIWEEIQNCKYNVYIPDKKQLEIIYNVNKRYKLLSLSTDFYWSSSYSAYLGQYYSYAFGVDFSDGYVSDCSKTIGFRSVALLHF